MISLAAIGIELKVRSNKGLTKKVTNHLYIYFPRRNLVDKIICVRGNNAIDLIVGLLVALMVILVIFIFLNCGFAGLVYKNKISKREKVIHRSIKLKYCK